MALTVWNRVHGLVFGGAIGAAFSRAVGPVLEPITQKAWMRNQVRVLPLGRLGEVAAKGLATLDSLVEEASRTGFDQTRLEMETALSQSYPDLGTLDQLQNRQLIKPELIDKALSRHGIPGEYHESIKATFQNLLGLAEVANGVQQGHLPNPVWAEDGEPILPALTLGTEPPGGWTQPVAPDGQPPTDVPLTTLDLNPIKMAEDLGFTVPDLRLQANLSGLPPGPHDLLQLWNRNEISEDAVDAGLREGHLKTKWAGAFKRLRWGILSPQEAASARLRQWLTEDEAAEIGKLHGLTKEQMELLFLNRGRPASPTQMWTAWARKVDGPRGVPTEFEDHAKAIAISDIRPEYSEMLWGIRFAYPALFMINRLVQAKAITVDTAVKWAEYDRYGDDVTGPLRVYWTKLAAGTGGAGGAGAKEATASDLLTLLDGGKATRDDTITALEALGYPADEAALKVDVIAARRVVGAKQTAITDLHGGYKKQEIDRTTAENALQALGESAATATQIVDAWQEYLTAAATAPTPPPV